MTAAGDLLMGTDDVRRLEAMVRRRHPELGDAVEVRHRRSQWATSRALDEVDVQDAHGSVVRLMVKHAGSDGLLDGPRTVRPAFLRHERREAAMYRTVLDAGALGTAAFYGELGNRGSDCRLVLERVGGSELHESGDLQVWRDTVRWLARFHSRFGGANAIPRHRPWLLSYDMDYLWRWPARAAAAGHGRRLERILDGYARVVAAIGSMPGTIVHGELYSSNVLVAGGPEGRRVCVIDWETAGVGPALLDLAALGTGWPEPERRALVAAYLEGLPHPPACSLDELLVGVDLCQLHLAVQWLGWAPAGDWSPPARNDCDWLEVAATTASRLRL